MAIGASDPGLWGREDNTRPFLKGGATSFLFYPKAEILKIKITIMKQLRTKLHTKVIHLQTPPV